MELLYVLISENKGIVIGEGEELELWDGKEGSESEYWKN